LPAEQCGHCRYYNLKACTCERPTPIYHGRQHRSF
jgi:hypothetical protein